MVSINLIIRSMILRPEVSELNIKIRKHSYILFSHNVVAHVIRGILTLRLVEVTRYQVIVRGMSSYADITSSPLLASWLVVRDST